MFVTPGDENRLRRKSEPNIMCITSDTPKPNPDTPTPSHNTSKPNLDVIGTTPCNDTLKSQSAVINETKIAEKTLTAITSFTAKTSLVEK